LPFGSGLAVVIVIAPAEFVVSEKTLLPERVGFPVSVAVTVKLQVEALVGVPVIAPVLALMLAHGGVEPDHAQL
jgi:hypothetical protein